MGEAVTQVYVVTHGEYQDSGISSVWLTLDEAKTAAAETHGKVEVYGIGETPRTFGSFWRAADFDGVTGEVTYESADDSAGLPDAETVEILCWPFKNIVGVRVTAETQERADKVFSEVRVKVLADIDLGLPARTIANREYVNGSWRSIAPQ